MKVLLKILAPANIPKKINPKSPGLSMGLAGTKTQGEIIAPAAINGPKSSLSKDMTPPNLFSFYGTDLSI